MQILCNLRDVPTLLGVCPSDLLPTMLPVSRSTTLVVYTDPHIAEGTHWLATHLQTRSYSGYLFWFLQLAHLVPHILAFLRRTCNVWACNATQLQVFTSTICGKYCCLFALYVDCGFTPNQFVGLFDGAIADRQVKRFASEFGLLREYPRGGHCCTCVYKMSLFYL